MDRLVKRMKLRRVTGTIVHHCALMIKYLEREGVKARLVKGWCVYGQEACTHYWVQDENGAVYDVGYELGCLYNPELMAYTPRLCDLEPAGLVFADANELASASTTSTTRTGWRFGKSPRLKSGTSRSKTPA